VAKRRCNECVRASFDSAIPRDRMKYHAKAINSFKRLVAVLAVIAGAGTITLLSASTASAAVVATFSSQQTGTSGQTAEFTVGGPWTMAWTYNCANAYGGTGDFIINYLGTFDIGPNESGSFGKRHGLLQRLLAHTASS